MRERPSLAAVVIRAVYALAHVSHTRVPTGPYTSRRITIYVVVRGALQGSYNATVCIYRCAAAECATVTSR